jgi:predicted SnoaL-like aldol condensation-catalyzing enzyme
MGRTKGKTNINKDVLLQIIAKFLPTGEAGWRAVAESYSQHFNEAVRDSQDLKNYFITKICDNHRKPTGNLYYILFLLFIL